MGRGVTGNSIGNWRYLNNYERTTPNKQKYKKAKNTKTQKKQKIQKPKKKQKIQKPKYIFYDKTELNSLISSCLEIERGPTVLFLLL